MKMAAINLYDYPQADYRGHVGSVCMTQAFDAVGWECKNYCRFTVEDKIDEIVAENFDLVCLNITSPIDPLLKVVNALSPKTKVLTFADGLAEQLEHFDFGQKPNYIEIMNKSNLVITSSDTGKKYLEIWTNTPVESIGLVVNYNLITAGVLGSKFKREEDLVLCGYLCYRPFHSIIYAIKICKMLGLRALLVQLDEQCKYEEILLDMGLDNIVIVKATSQEGYLEDILSRVSFSVFLPVRETLSRTGAECACIKIPSIGTKSYFQNHLFPSFTIDNIYELEDMLRFVTSHYSKHAVETELVFANEKVKEYNPLPYGIKLCNILDVPKVR